MESTKLAVGLVAAVLVSGCGREITYYYSEDLVDRSLPEWSPTATNECPLSENEAVAIAIEYAAGAEQTRGWDVEQINLEPILGVDSWKYSVLLKQRDSHNVEHVIVLLDGSVWEPTKENRH